MVVLKSQNKFLCAVQGDLSNLKRQYDVMESRQLPPQRVPPICSGVSSSLHLIYSATNEKRARILLPGRGFFRETVMLIR
ncbi:unnamed protein product [Urochloa humidicola]